MPSIRSDSPIHDITRALSQRDPIAELADRVERRAFAGETVPQVPVDDIFETTKEAHEAIVGLASYPNYLRASVPEGVRRTLEREVAYGDPVSHAVSTYQGKGPQAKANVEASLNGALNVQVAGLLARRANELREQASGGLEAYRAQAEALIADLGLTGYATRDEVLALTTFFVERAESASDALERLTGNVNYVSGVEANNLPLQQVKATYDAVKQLETELWR